MNTTIAGLFAGVALGFAGYFGGFGALLVVAVVGAAGLLVGHLARRDGYLASLLRGRDDTREERLPRGADDARWRERHGLRRTGRESRAHPPVRERVQ